MRFLRVGAVVGHEDENGVVVLAARLEVVDYPADAFVEQFDHRGIDFHLARLADPFLVGKLGPAWELAAALVHRQVGRDQAHRLHPRMTFGPDRVIPAIVAAAVRLEPFVRNLKRIVRRGVGEIAEEGALGPGIRQKLDHPVGIVRGRIEPFRQTVGHVAAIVVIQRLWPLAFGQRENIVEMAGAAAQEGKDPVEPAMFGPLPLVLAQMPFAGEEGGIAGIAQHLGEGDDLPV